MTCPNARVGSKSKMKKLIFERSRSDLSLGNTLFKSHYIFIPDQYNNSIVHLLLIRVQIPPATILFFRYVSVKVNKHNI